MNKPIESRALKEMHRIKLPLSAEHSLHVELFNLHEEPKPYFNMHYALELGIVLSGRVRRYYLRWQTELETGQAWLCGIWEPHGFLPLKLPCQVIVFSILPEMLAMTRLPGSASFDWLAPFIVPPPKRPYVKPARSDFFLSAGRRALEASQQKGKAEEILLRLLLLEIIAELCRDWSFPAYAETTPHDSFETVNRVVETVFKSRKLIPVHEASKACGLRKEVFTMLFKKVMGISFADFSLRYRLDGAREQLINSQDPVKMIATEWGFTDKSHFHHVFQQYYGCTPSEFRERHLQVNFSAI